MARSIGVRPALIERRSHLEALDDALAHSRCGGSRAIVLEGAAGSGKTALLDAVADRAEGFRIVRIAGLPPEFDVPFAGLHRLCAPFLDRLDVLAEPQARALRTTFGMQAGAAPDRVLIGAAVRALLAAAASERPLLCLVDDVQWLDGASAAVITLVARRLDAECLLLVLSTRDPDRVPDGPVRLRTEGLSRAGARALLDAVSIGRVDDRVREQILAESQGNPQALIDVAGEIPATRLAGGFGLPGAVAVSPHLEEAFRRRLQSLPEESRLLLVLASADPTGDPALLRRAAPLLGIRASAWSHLGVFELAHSPSRVWFRHPRGRAAVYRAAPDVVLHAAHGALAEVTDATLHPDRKAWHRAHATVGPDENVASELERAAPRARIRGGVAAAAAFLERAAMLTPDPSERARRAIVGAHAKARAGDPAGAADLLAAVDGVRLPAEDAVRAELARAEIAAAGGRAEPQRLLDVAKRLETIDTALAEATYLDAIRAAVRAGRQAAPGGDIETAAHAAIARQRTTDAGPDVDRVAEPLRSLLVATRPVDAPQMFPDRELRRLSLATIAAIELWDDRHGAALAEQHRRLGQQEGAIGEMLLARSAQAVLLVVRGRLPAAAALVEELRVASCAHRGPNPAPHAALALAAFRGRAEETAALLAPTLVDAARRGVGAGVTLAEWASAVLDNGRGHYRSAMAAAQRATADPRDIVARGRALVELVEAAMRSGERATAETALADLARTTRGGTDGARGIEARSRALTAEGTEAERLYREAIERLAATRMRADLARAQLLYGEWLRRERRRGDARIPLRTAYELFEDMTMAGFAARARRELWATGEHARHRDDAGNPALTAQELEIARLAQDGLSNPQIGARLFLSARTVEHHLGKVFLKLGITSRAQLDRR